MGPEEKEAMLRLAARFVRAAYRRTLTDGNDGYATTPAGNRAKRDTETTEYLHVNVNPHVVRALRLTTIPLPPNTNEQKRKTVEELHRRITDMRRQL